MPFSKGILFSESNKQAGSVAPLKPPSCLDPVRQLHYTKFASQSSQHFSQPHKLHNPTSEYVVRQIEVLWHQRWTDQRATAELGISPSTVSRTLHRLGPSRIKDINPLPLPRRYGRSRPGEMIHIDIKKLKHFKVPRHRITGWHTGMHRSGGAGWEYLHVCIDNYSCVAFSTVMLDKNARSEIVFLQAAGACYQNFEITMERVMIDNGP